MKKYNMDALSLMLPNASHEAEYARVMDKWEALEDNIQPQLMRRYSSSAGANVSFATWLAWCEDDRTTGAMLSTQVPCSLHFLLSRKDEILGSIVINHANTKRGHLHAGIVPWHRGKGYGAAMLNLALSRCLEMGIEQVEIVPYKSNAGAVRTILRNGGVYIGELEEDGIVSLRFEIDARKHAGGKFVDCC